MDRILCVASVVFVGNLMSEAWLRRGLRSRWSLVQWRTLSPPSVECKHCKCGKIVSDCPQPGPGVNLVPSHKSTGLLVPMEIRPRVADLFLPYWFTVSLLFTLTASLPRAQYLGAPVSPLCSQQRPSWGVSCLQVARWSSLGLCCEVRLGGSIA